MQIQLLCFLLSILFRVLLQRAPVSLKNQTTMRLPGYPGSDQQLMSIYIEDPCKAKMLPAFLWRAIIYFRFVNAVYKKADPCFYCLSAYTPLKKDILLFAGQ